MTNLVRVGILSADMTTAVVGTASEGPATLPFSPAKVVVGVNMRVDQRDRLGLLAGSRSSNLSAEVRRALDRYLADELASHPYVSLKE